MFSLSARRWWHEVVAIVVVTSCSSFLPPRQCYLIRLVLCHLEIHQITLFSRSWIRQGGEKHRLRGDQRGPTFTLHQQTNWQTKRGGRQSEGFNVMRERGKVLGVWCWPFRFIWPVSELVFTCCLLYGCHTSTRHSLKRLCSCVCMREHMLFVCVYVRMPGPFWAPRFLSAPSGPAAERERPRVSESPSRWKRLCRPKKTSHGSLAHFLKSSKRREESDTLSQSH